MNQSETAGHPPAVAEEAEVAFTPARAEEVAERVRQQLRDYPDFPRPGILFRDVMPLFQDHVLFSDVIGVFADHATAVGAEKIAGIESRGFLFGVPVGLRLGVPFIAVRKKGKLPGETIAAEYDLEYGNSHLELQADAVRPGERVLIVDDLLATGGTAAATASLIEELGGTVAALQVLVELAALPGREAVDSYNIFALLTL
ncbi:MAG: adenine phosphoribosyltransferase [Gemmatimonadota bacterium]